MAEGGRNSLYNMYTVENEIMDFSDKGEEYLNYVLPIESRRDNYGGRGSGLKQRRQTKRKKVSSTDSTASIDMETFSNFENGEKFSCLFEYVLKNSAILDEVKSEQTFCQASKELKSYVDVLFEQTRNAERVIQHQTKFMKMLTYKFIDNEAKCRRNNLIVWGVSERNNVRDDTLMLNFLEDEMSIDTSDIVIVSAQRIGSKMSQRNRNLQDPKRPIIVKFGDVYDTERVMRKAFKLKGTPFGIDRDYPREIAAARRELYRSEEANNARFNKDKLQIKYPAKLFINGSLICDKFPEWVKYLNESLISCLDSDQIVESNVTSSSSKLSYKRKQRSEAIYNLDTDEDRTSDIPEEEQEHCIHDSVFTGRCSSNVHSDAKDAIAIRHNSRSDNLSTDSKKTNHVSSESKYTRSSQNKVKLLPQSTRSHNKPSDIKIRKSTQANTNKVIECSVSSVNNLESKYMFSTHS